MDTIGTNDFVHCSEVSLAQWLTTPLLQLCTRTLPIIRVIIILEKGVGNIMKYYCTGGLWLRRDVYLRDTVVYGNMSQRAKPRKPSILRNSIKSKARRAPVRRARKNWRFSVDPTIPVQTPHDHNDDPLAELYDDKHMKLIVMWKKGNGRL